MQPRVPNRWRTWHTALSPSWTPRYIQDATGVARRSGVNNAVYLMTGKTWCYMTGVKKRTMCIAWGYPFLHPRKAHGSVINIEVNNSPTLTFIIGGILISWAPWYVRSGENPSGGPPCGVHLRQMIYGCVITPYSIFHSKREMVTIVVSSTSWFISTVRTWEGQFDQLHSPNINSDN